MPQKETIIEGSNTAHAKFKKGFVGSIGAGYTFKKFFRSDLMFRYRKNKSKKFANVTAEIDTYSAMLNGYLSATNDTIFAPYLMAGIGVGNNHTTSKGGDSEKLESTNFIWNIGAGCQTKVYEHISIDLEYRYASLGVLGSKPLIGKEGPIKLKGKEFRVHEVLLGLIYNF